MSALLNSELQGLKRKLLTVSALVEQSLAKAVRAIAKRDELLARQVVEADNEIDFKEVDVEEECLKILALHQPVAIDLRVVIATLKINNDLERIGDLASNIAHRAIYLAQKKPISIPFDYDQMSERVRAMLKESIDSFVQLDSSLARQVCDRDDEIDQLNRDMYNKVYQSIRSNPDLVESFVHYLTISRNLERIGDYATNIAEDVIYMIEGKIIRHDAAIR